MNAEENRIYQRGYQAGARKRWPKHRPPAPPLAVVAHLMASLSDIGDELDAFLATIDDDEFAAKLNPLITRGDEAIKAVTEWLFDGTEDLEQLAGAIVEKLFVNGNGERAERLKLILAGDRDGGGWSAFAARDQIFTVLSKNQQHPNGVKS
jgi:hypothetical protein